MNVVERQWRASVAEDAQTAEFLALADEHGGAVMAFLRRLCRHEQDAEDVFQETAAKVWRQFSLRTRVDNPRAWLFTIAYRTFLDRRAKDKSHEAFVDSADSRHGTPAHNAQRREESERVHGALNNLSERMREVVVLHYMGGLTLRETAAAMGISEGTVKSRLSTALQELRGILQ